MSVGQVDDDRRGPVAERGVALTAAAARHDVLREVADAVAGTSSSNTLRMRLSAFVLAARLEQTAEERLRGVSRLCWASAGHLPPLLVAPDGTQRLLDTGRPGLLLGVDPTLPRTAHEL